MSRRQRPAAAGANGKYAAHSQSMIRAQNDAMIDQLHGKVAMLKDLTIQIGDETREHNKFLDGLSDDFGAAGTMMSSTMKRLTNMINTGSGKHICYLILFAFFFLLLLWRLIKK